MPSSANAETFFFIPRGEHRLATVLHAADAREIVILAHGFTGSKIEQGRLFVQCARALAARGISALRFDFMGSGDSSGEFSDMTPNTEIADLHAVIDWARARGYRRIGLLGLSMGGAVSLCTAAQRPAGDLAAVCTWSSVPGFGFWRPTPAAADLDRQNVLRVGRRFYSDRPAIDVPQAYCSLGVPKLQIQGDRDLPGFRSRFAAFFAAAPEPKRHVIVPGADHVFTRMADRRRVIAETVRFFCRTLTPARQTGRKAKRWNADS